MAIDMPPCQGIEYGLGLRSTGMRVMATAPCEKAGCYAQCEHIYVLGEAWTRTGHNASKEPLTQANLRGNRC
jgi:hypothetical protein